MFPPATAELAAAVAPAEAGQLAADGNFTLTLYKGIVSKLRVLHFLEAGKHVCNLQVLRLTYHIIERRH